MSRRATLRIVAVEGDLVPAEEPPTVEPAARTAANDRTKTAPGWGPEAEAARAVPADTAVPRRWRSLPALALSLAIHSMLIVAAVAALTRAGSEAETDAVAVEIVFEAPPAPPAEPAASEPAVIVPAPDATTEALLAEPPVFETPEAAEAIETAEIVPAPDAATEMLLADPPVVEAPETPDAVEVAGPDVATPVEKPAGTMPPVDALEIVPLPDAVTEALLAEPPVVEAPAPAEAEPISAPQPIEPAETEAIELPTPDPALAVLSAPPTFADDATVAPPPVAADPLEAPLPDSVAVTPSPRPLAGLPAAADKPSPAEVKKPAPRKTAEAAKAKAGTTDAPRKKTAAPAEAKPAPAPKKAAALPAAKRPAKAQAGSGAAAAAGAGASAGAEAAYGRKLLSHIERRKRYPAAARAAKATGAVRLSVSIDRSGNLRSARVTGGSGHAVLDEEALATARRAAPYPAPPDGVGGKTYAFSVTLRFSR